MTALILADVPGAAEQLRHLFVRPRAAGDTLSHKAVRALCDAGLARRGADDRYEITEAGIEFMFGSRPAGESTGATDEEQG